MVGWAIYSSLTPILFYLFNHKALAKVFRAKILAGIEAAGLA
jgi:hypothetical protein